jgi:hypothetical protein
VRPPLLSVVVRPLGVSLMETTKAMLIAWIGFSAIALLTWFFSSRPRLFIRVFVPREEYRVAVPAILRDRGFQRDMRQMSLLQFGVGGILGLVGLWLTFV